MLQTDSRMGPCFRLCLVRSRCTKVSPGISVAVRYVAIHRLTHSMKNYVGTFLTIVLLNVAGWATNAVSGSVPLAESTARADSAYRSLPLTLAAYNAAVR